MAAGSLVSLAAGSNMDVDIFTHAMLKWQPIQPKPYNDFAVTPVVRPAKKRKLEEDCGLICPRWLHLESHEDWTRRWKQVYPADFVDTIGHIRNLTPVTHTLPAAVYVVIRHSYGNWATDVLDVLGTYNNVAAADEAVMVYLMNSPEYSQFIKPGEDREYFFRGKPEPWSTNRLIWDVDTDGCLTFYGDVGDEDGGDHWVWVKKQHLQSQPPEFEAPPKTTNSPNALWMPPSAFDKRHDLGRLLN